MEKVIEQFDRQIKKEFQEKLIYAISEQNLNLKEIIKWKKDKKNLIKCESYLSKEIFLKSLNFTIKDWKEIRKGNYYDELLLEKGIAKKIYILDKINQYLKTK
jgi:hypothetical protein